MDPYALASSNGLKANMSPNNNNNKKTDVRRCLNCYFDLHFPND